MKERISEIIAYFNKGQIITNILLVGIVVYLIITGNDFSYNSFWLLSTLLLLCNVYFISGWTNREKEVDLDKNKSKVVKGSFDDITAITLVFYGLLFLGIQFIDFFDESVRTNLYVALGFYAATLIFQLFCFLAVDNSLKKNRELITKDYPKLKRAKQTKR